MHPCGGKDFKKSDTYYGIDCLIGSELLCENQKCIPIQLQCDGFDHCGDNSDEPESCKSGKNAN